MNELEIRKLIRQQRAFFYKGRTLPANTRIHMLKKLRSCILKYQEEIHRALKLDLGKSSFESYMCETGLVLDELRYMIKHIPKFSKEKTVPTPLSQFVSRSYITPSPYGVVLIMSPWNYPFLLSLTPLVDAIAAGNTVIVKPSAYAPNTSEVIRKIICEAFPPFYAAVVTGGRKENTCLLNEHFDYIFFTGSQHVGKEVMAKAARFLTPVTLELGGKSPCIVEKTANLELAAKRIVFGKFLNCGQTCVAPDYVYCDRRVKDSLISEIKKQIRKQFTGAPLSNPDYGKIINQKHFQRILALIDPSKTVFGGENDPNNLRIAPTLMDEVSFDDAVMQEEIFGPVLPVLTYDSLDQAATRINAMAHPLALYIFTENKKAAEKITRSCGFGGGCINDVVIHLATSQMGFGGFGESGIGSYHGKAGFDTFSHYKSIVDKKNWMDLPVRYQPYQKSSEKLLKLFLR